MEYQNQSQPNQANPAVSLSYRCKEHCFELSGSSSSYSPLLSNGLVFASSSVQLLRPAAAAHPRRAQDVDKDASYSDCLTRPLAAKLGRDPEALSDPNFGRGHQPVQLQILAFHRY